jgi:hypothetical protein
LKTIGLALVSLLVLSCSSGGDSETPANRDAAPGPEAGLEAGPEAQVDVFVDPLIGTWIDQISDTLVTRVKFDGTNFERDAIYELQSGAFGMVMDTGTYTLSTSEITARVRSSSCYGVLPFAGNTATWKYVRDGNSLSLTINTSYLLFQLATSAPKGMGVASIGCVEDDGTFVEHATQPVP